MTYATELYIDGYIIRPGIPAFELERFQGGLCRFRRVPHRLRHHSSPAFLKSFANSSEYICPGEVDDLIPSSVQHCLDHVQSEANHLVQLDRGWHRQFLPVDQNFDQRRSVMFERLFQQRRDLLGSLSFQSENAG